MHRGERKHWFGFVSGFLSWNLFRLFMSSIVSFCSLHSVAWSTVRTDSLALLSDWTAFLIDAAAFSRLMSHCTIWRWTSVPSLHLFSRPSGTLFHTNVLWGMVLWNHSQCTSQQYLKTHIFQESPDGYQDRFMGSWIEGGLSSIYPVYLCVWTKLPSFH